MKHFIQPLIATTVALCAALGAAPADAQTCAFMHPAIAHRAACDTPAGVDANTFIVQPPAMVSWRVDADASALRYAKPAHGNHAHPAVAVARMQQAGVDPNTFIVQPPVAVSWIVIAPAGLYAAGPAAGSAAMPAATAR